MKVDPDLVKKQCSRTYSREELLQYAEKSGGLLKKPRPSKWELCDIIYKRAHGRGRGRKIAMMVIVGALVGVTVYAATKSKPKKPHNDAESKSTTSQNLVKAANTDSEQQLIQITNHIKRPANRIQTIGDGDCLYHAFHYGFLRTKNNSHYVSMSNTNIDNMKERVRRYICNPDKETGQTYKDQKIADLEDFSGVAYEARAKKGAEDYNTFCSNYCVLDENKMNPLCWGTTAELQVLAAIYKVNIYLYATRPQELQVFTYDVLTRPNVYIYLQGLNHYSAVNPDGL